MNYYPMQFSFVLKEKIWGGRALEKILNKQLPSDKLYGESWEVSAHPNGLGIVLNGEFRNQTLPNILKHHGENIVGKEIWQKYEGIFPLLLKFLDINDKLSIQVHPDDMYAIPHEKSFGKAECWYIISASDDAKLIMGMKNGITKEQYLAKAYHNDFTNMFEEISVKADDLVVIHPGMVHASLEGSILLCELQQNSDITYRIYDFDRLENGIKRPLHIEKSADVINFNAQADLKHFENNTQSEIILLDWEYFSLSRIIIQGKNIRPSIPTMRLYALLAGQLTLTSNHTTLTLKKGDTILVPANLKIVLEGHATLLEAYPK